MNILQRKRVAKASLIAAAEENDFKAGLQEATALHHLFDSKYSEAAVACHRAHQFKLVADALRAEATL